ncbi:Hypothetical predicted protein [Octopus vulgaris]|uniref:Uncharacterized protein n=1 Tax=Octopus vulgaris TaxID=6645 RepID=A0AA36B0W5_OCTVU|nr:Hypothetical predicted protein [Octopus vulgaris]
MIVPKWICSGKCEHKVGCSNHEQQIGKSENRVKYLNLILILQPSENYASTRTSRWRKPEKETFSAQHIEESSEHTGKIETKQYVQGTCNEYMQ